MKHFYCIFLILFCMTALSAQTLSKAEMQNRQNRIKKSVQEMKRKRILYRDRIDAMKKMAQLPEFAPPALQLQIYEQILRYCNTPEWTSIQLYDYNTKNTELPQAVEKIQSLELPVRQKAASLRSLSVHYCDLENFGKAEETVRRIFALPGLHNNQLAEAHCALANVYRLQDRYGDAMKEIENAMTYHAVTAAKAGASIALKFDRIPDARKLWEKAGDQYGKLLWFKDKPGKNDFREEALAFIRDPEKKFSQRLELAMHYAGDTYGTEEMAEARKSLAPQAKQVRGGWYIHGLLRNPFKRQDYRLTAEWGDIFAGAPVMKDSRNRKIYIVSLGALGRIEEAVKLAETYSAEETCTPADRTSFQCLSAILQGKDISGILKNAGLTRKQEAGVISELAGFCLNAWNKSALAEEYAVRYESFFAEAPQRRMKVKYSEEGIGSIAAWRKVYPQLEKQYCDIPFRGSMDFLETDVTAGGRKVNTEKEPEKAKYTEITALCDKYGVHLFLRTEAENARAVENGFAAGTGSEIYIAPGKNQPYAAFGTDPASGLSFFFNTVYSNKNANRLSPDSARLFRMETEFTDSDYVMHLFFAWDAFGSSLPAEPGDVWRFECLSWTPSGGFSWGGSQGIHSASAWGDLVFSLTESQLSAIRKHIIFRTFRNYKNVSRDPGVRINLFDFWADEENGDPEFFAECLVPLQQELDSYAAMVKEDMTDAAVKKVYSEALPRWKALAHEVDELRRKYLAERLIRTGR